MDNYVAGNCFFPASLLHADERERDEQKIYFVFVRTVKGINDYLNGRLLNAEAFLPSMLRLMRGNYTKQPMSVIF